MPFWYVVTYCAYTNLPLTKNEMGIKIRKPLNGENAHKFTEEEN